MTPRLSRREKQKPINHHIFKLTAHVETLNEQEWHIAEITKVFVTHMINFDHDAVFKTTGNATALDPITAQIASQPWTEANFKSFFRTYVVGKNEYVEIDLDSTRNLEEIIKQTRDIIKNYANARIVTDSLELEKDTSVAMFLDSDPYWINRDARHREMEALISGFPDFSAETATALGQFHGGCPPFKLLKYHQFEFPEKVVTVTTQKKNVPILRDCIMELSDKNAMKFLIRQEYCYTIKEYLDNLGRDKSYAENTINQHVAAVAAQQREGIWNVKQPFLDMMYKPAHLAHETTIRKCLEHTMHIEPHFQRKGLVFVNWRKREHEVCYDLIEEDEGQGSRNQHSTRQHQPNSNSQIQRIYPTNPESATSYQSCTSFSCFISKT